MGYGENAVGWELIDELVDILIFFLKSDVYFRSRNSRCPKSSFSSRIKVYSNQIGNSEGEAVINLELKT